MNLATTTFPYAADKSRTAAGASGDGITPRTLFAKPPGPTPVSKEAADSTSATTKTSLFGSLSFNKPPAQQAPTPQSTSSAAAIPAASKGFPGFGKKNI